MANGDVSDAEGLKEFFDIIWRETNGYVYLPTIDRKTTKWRNVFYKWPEHRDYVVQHVMTASARGLDVYYAPALFKDSKSTKDNVLGTNVVWAEFDGNAPETWGQDAPSEGPGQPQDGLAGIPAPSVRVQTSKDGNQHVYWLLEELQEDVKWIDSTNRSLAYTLRSDTSGWDAGQILRPPYTTNYKHDLPVTVVQQDPKTTYPFTEFKTLKPVMQLVSDSIDTNNLPSVERIIAKYAWDESSFEMFMDPQIPEGKRSSALMRLGFFGAEQGMSDLEIYALLDNADSRWGKFTNRTDRRRRLLDIVNRAKTKYPSAVEANFSGLLGRSDDRVELDKQYIYGFQDFLDSDVHVEWVINNFLMKEGMGMIASAPGVGKTQYSLQLAIHVATGEEFLGYEMADPNGQKVVFFSLEMDHISLKHFIETMSVDFTEEKKAKLQENLLIVPLGEALPISRPETMKFMHTILDDVKPQGIFFDALSKLNQGKFNPETAVALNDFYASVRNRYECFIWVVHHNRKANGDNAKPTELEDVYGDVYLTTDMSTVVTLWEEEGKIEMNVVKLRLSPRPEPVILQRTGTLGFEISNAIVDLPTNQAGGPPSISGSF